MNTRRLHQIETEAADLLLKSRISSAPVDVEKVARHLNITVKRTASQDDISGFLLVHAGGHVIIGVNMLHHPNRQRFTIAHEIGHYMLHDFQEVHIDRAVLKLRNQTSSRGEYTEEVEANRFAAELLMPAQFLEGELTQLSFLDLHDDRGLVQLAKRYQVSVQAMTNRLTSLGVLPDLSIKRRLL